MSLPRSVPPPSSSPSKPSLRRPSASSQPRTLLPSPHFEDDPIIGGGSQSLAPPSHALPAAATGSLLSEHAVHDDSSHLAPPTLHPFFTLISDPATSEHHHPTVHYIFADDDTDILAEAALRALETIDPTQRPAPSSQAQYADAADASSSSPSPPRLPPAHPSVNEHYLIVDLAPTPTSFGVAPPPASHSASPSSQAPPPPFTVTAATSLSPDWAVLRASITAAPTIGPNEDGGADSDEGLMLRIEGRGNAGAAADGGREGETMEELIERFQRGLDEVRLVMSANVEGGAGQGVGPAGGDEGQ